MASIQTFSKEKQLGCNLCNNGQDKILITVCVEEKKYADHMNLHASHDMHVDFGASRPSTMQHSIFFANISMTVKL